MKTLEHFNFKGEKALIRVDFNVPLNDQFEITDDARIQAALPTIQKILADGGSCILMSHLGRPKNGPEDKFSLKHIIAHLSKLTSTNVQFANDCIGEEAINKATALAAGQVLLLENVRFYKEETTGDEAFAEKLSKLGSIYVNDAFGTAHRAHASTTIAAKFFSNDQRMFGYLMGKEVANADKVMNKAAKPFTAIVGGAKVSDKILIIENLINTADNIIIGGGMAYTFFKAKGGSIGNSLVEDDKLDLANEIMAKAIAKGVKILLPEDSIVADNFSNDANTNTAENTSIEDGWMGLDIGPKAVDYFTDTIKNSKTVLWNGPMGVFEMSKFENGTKSVAASLADATSKGAFTLIGGGDSAAAIKKFNYKDQVSYVSTGGGALLEYFEGKELPGIAAISK
jgi:phosphoglycerate kinase